VYSAKKILTTFVTKENLNLFGLPWINKLEEKLNYPIVTSIKNVKTVEILQIDKVFSEQAFIKKLKVKFKKVFEEGLGHCTKMKAHLFVKPEVKPVFVKLDLYLLK
jgi:hypothetical protein